MFIPVTSPHNSHSHSPTSPSFSARATYTLKNLRSGAVYDIVAKAKNKFGWSQLSKVFNFFNKGVGKCSHVLTEGQSMPLIMFVLFHFLFFVFLQFWQRSYENRKILHNLCLHFARQDGQDGKKAGMKITQLK